MAGQVGGTPLSTLSSATPQALGTAAAGTSALASHADHVHAKPALSDLTSGSTASAYLGGQSVSAPTAISGATATAAGHYVLKLTADATYTLPPAADKRVLVFLLNGHTLTLTAYSGDSVVSTLSGSTVSSAASVGSVTIIGDGSTTSLVDGV